MTATRPATRSAKELWDLTEGGEYGVVHEESDPSWRHGEYRTTVVKDAEGRFWCGTYCVTGDGEQHEWRDGMAADFHEVEPYTTTVTAHRAKHLTAKETPKE